MKNLQSFLCRFFVCGIWVKLSLAVFDGICYNKMNYVDNTVGVYALCITRLLEVNIRVC